MPIASGKLPCKFLKHMLYHELSKKQMFALIPLIQTRTSASLSQEMELKQKS